MTDENFQLRNYYICRQFGHQGGYIVMGDNIRTCVRCGAKFWTENILREYDQPTEQPETDQPEL